MRDPVTAATAAHGRVVAAQADFDQAVADRAVAIAALRDAGWSLGRIAELLGVSKSRVAQIVTPPPAARAGRGGA